MTKKQRAKAGTWIKKLREQQRNLQNCVTVAEEAVTSMCDLIGSIETLVDGEMPIAVCEIADAFESTTNSLDELKLEAVAVELKIDALQPFINELEKSERRELKL